MLIRPMVDDNLPRLLDLQRDASVIILASVFPQDPLAGSTRADSTVSVWNHRSLAPDHRVAGAML